MLSFSGALVKQSMYVGRSLLMFSKPREVFRVVGSNQYRWLVQKAHTSVRVSPTAAQSSDKDKKITPLGWFLLLIPITTFGLGCWQVKRKAWKEKLIKDMEALTKMAPFHLPENLADMLFMEYRLVTVRGKFLHERELLMGPRSLIRPDGAESGSGLFSQRSGGNGYLVITPFQLADRDDVILINRGWVPRNQTKPETRQQGQIQDEIELTGVVRTGEQRPQFTPDHKGDIFLYRDLGKMCAQTGAAPILLDATYESSIPGGPIGGQTRVTLRNEHMSYLITWFSLSVATSYLWYRQIVKRIPF